MADVADDVENLETVLSAAVRLHDNGQSTDMTLIPVDRFNRGLGLSSTLIPSWSLMLVIGDGPAPLARIVAAKPVGVNMRRVSATRNSFRASRIALRPRGQYSASAAGSTRTFNSRSPAAGTLLTASTSSACVDTRVA
jgi:hypothetical protein